MGHLISFLATSIGDARLWRHKKLSVFPLSIAAILLLCSTWLTSGQEVIVHGSYGHITTASDEDGNRKYDADGDTNGVVVWKSNAVHVLCTKYRVGPLSLTYGKFKKYTLKIGSDAIVKLASRFEVINGQLVWEAHPSGGVTADVFEGWYDYTGQQDPTGEHAGVVQIEGATITDIRDDDVGGDTNQDGGTFSPPKASEISFEIMFSGSPLNFIRHSTIKYFRRISQIGNIQITNCIFAMFGRLDGGPYHSSYTPYFAGAVPIIEDNVFEFASYKYDRGCLYVRGLSPVIQRNIFRYAIDAEKPRYAWEYDPVIWAGLDYYGDSKIPYPQGGVTIIMGNTFQTGGGITIAASGSYINNVYVSDLLKTRFQARIENNKFYGPFTVGRGYTCLTLPIAAEVAVRNNNPIYNYEIPITFDISGQADVQSKVELTGNWFVNCDQTRFPGPESPGDLSSYWSKGIYINGTKNYWGDPTGPLDKYGDDGFVNPDGKGVKIGNGIRYIPFIGGTKPPPKDAIHMQANSDLSQPFHPNADVTFDVVVDECRLESAPTGKIVVIFRDDDGIILNNPSESSIPVTSHSQTANFPPIQIRVPELSRDITIEAVLTPGGSNETVISNLQTFRVNVPPTAFALIGIADADTRRAPRVIRGESIRLKVDFSYTYSGGEVVLVIEPKELKVPSGIVVSQLPPITSSFPAGTNMTQSTLVDFELPFRDAFSVPGALLDFRVTLKTTGGSEIGKDSRHYTIDPGGSITLFALVPLQMIDPPFALYNYFEVDHMPHHVGVCAHEIRTKNVNDWQIVPTADALDVNGTVLHHYIATIIAPRYLSTGSGRDTIGVRGETAIPPGTKIYRAYYQLKRGGADGITVAYDVGNIEVYKRPFQSVERAVPAGPSEVDFTPCRARLSFSSNQTAGTAYAEEFDGQFGTSSTLAKLSPMMQLNSFYWNFIPLTRYWSVSDTLKDRTFAATISFVYDPAADFPAVAGFSEDSLVIAGLNPLSGELQELPTILDKTTHTVTTTYTKFFDTWVVASRTTIPLVAGVLSGPGVLPNDFFLEQNFPNPFNPTTVVTYQLPVANYVTLKVYNLLGQEVMTLVDEEQDPGTKSVKLNANGLASGVYFYRLQAGSFVQTKKLLLLR